MLMPVRLKGKDKEKYVKDNARLLIKGKSRRTRINKHVGLRVAGAIGKQASKQKVEETAFLKDKSASSSR